MKTKIYITDEGFGPIVRQSAVLEELKKLIPELNITLQLDKHLEDAKHIIPNVSYKKKFNNVIWQKNADGTPDTHAIEKYYSTYSNIADTYIASEKSDLDYDFLISDFVYEAFVMGAEKKIPVFGIAHFTWDWFFSKFYPPVVPQSVIQTMMASALQADTLFFPSFTPREILSQYKSKIIEVPLIVRKQRQQPKIRQGNTKKIMFIDSGSGVNKLAMLEIAKQLPALTNFHFYIGEQLGIQSENITPIPQKELLVDYIAQMDLVVGRAGFNTISECIAYRTPMLLFGESSNPEMRENTVFVKEQGLGSFISIETLIRSTEKVLNDFFEGEYSVVERNMNLHTFRTDGAKVIAEIIAEKMSKK